ncbi:hypothetical protein L861_20315 [Litchfieldella anticariensis FP35 = DSM 16096]|uniref:Lipoprotein n=1 Tax=Litchfieldella anticariensis (strain DSM 16096 / CECT 5854 / CIP 108499 / LMG 22089 / FP35) TaxID=1121939 RepID=S2L2Q7_LITA3|nr:hypothetical protein [Halomonas anticariensis]EPC01999.1 hypothetical protein L861_20315 [Halomonas anticariensis FP35 = DSM 16096]
MPSTKAPLLFLLLLTNLLVSCALPPEPQVALYEPSRTPYAIYAPSQWDRKGLEAQPRLAAYRDRLPPDVSYTPGTTSWQEVSHEVPGALTIAVSRQDSPGTLLQALASELDLGEPLGRSMWEQTQRIYREDERAIGVILQWGFYDDAIQGQDYRVWMRQNGQGWYVERMETRYHCGRGIGENGLCI